MSAYHFSELSLIFELIYHFERVFLQEVRNFGFQSFILASWKKYHFIELSF